MKMKSICIVRREYTLSFQGYVWGSAIIAIATITIFIHTLYEHGYNRPVIVPIIRSHISLYIGIAQATVYAVKGLSNQWLSVHESIHCMGYSSRL